MKQHRFAALGWLLFSLLAVTLGLSRPSAAYVGTILDSLAAGTALPVAYGGTASTSASAARSALGVSNVFDMFVAGQGIHPTSNSATLSVRSGRLHGVYSFDQTTGQTMNYEGVLAPSYDSTSNLTVTLYVTSTATSGGVVFSAEIEAITSSLDIDADSFDAAKNSATTTISGTSGVAVPCTITLANSEADDITAGLPYRLRITRVVADAGDDMAAPAQVLRVVVSQ